VDWDSSAEKVSGTVVGTSYPVLYPRVHGTTCSCRLGRTCLSHSEPSQRPTGYLPRRRRLCRVRTNPGRSRDPVRYAVAGLMPDAQSLPPPALSPRRWGPVSIHAMADPDPHPAVARSSRHHRLRSSVPRSFQVVPPAIRRAPHHRLPLRRAKRAARRLDRPGRGLAMGEPVAKPDV
jgi:hypothetical protein